MFFIPTLPFGRKNEVAIRRQSGDCGLGGFLPLAAISVKAASGVLSSPAWTTAMKLLDSRRLTGPNLLLPRAGAVLEVSLIPEEAETAVAVWRQNVRSLLAAVGWPDEEIAVRRFAGGASLAISAPIDSLYAATEVNEQAWAAAEAAVAGGPAPDLMEAAAKLRRKIAQETNPALLAMQSAAATHEVAFLWDDEAVSVGLGTGA